MGFWVFAGIIVFVIYFGTMIHLMGRIERLKEELNLANIRRDEAYRNYTAAKLSLDSYRLTDRRKSARIRPDLGSGFNDPPR